MLSLFLILPESVVVGMSTSAFLTIFAAWMAMGLEFNLHRCILDVPLSVGVDPRHFDPLLAGKGLAGAVWLVQSLQSLIDAGFKMATGQVYV